VRRHHRDARGESGAGIGVGLPPVALIVSVSNMSRVGRAIVAVPPLMAGLAYAAIVVLVGFVLSWQWSEVSPLTVSLVISVVLANVGLCPAGCDAGLRFAARHVLRAGIVLLGLQLSFDEVAHLGGRGLAAVMCIVTATFFGTRVIARLLGLSPGLGLLTATGYSICGVSAISAMVGAVDGDEEDATYAIALVTLFGSISIFILPFIGHVFDTNTVRFGMWSGAAVHDVAQVVATATAFAPGALAPAIIVKLTRVLLLAPLVTVIAVRHRRTAPPTESRVSPLPAFIVLFITMVAIRTSGILSNDVIASSKHVEKVALALALVGLGSGVRMAKLRVLGARPALLGLASWVLVMVASALAIHFVPLDVVG
jgi:uncharacterized integral membrane protein (TIGR00698 family)